MMKKSICILFASFAILGLPVCAQSGPAVVSVGSNDEVWFQELAAARAVSGKALEAAVKTVFSGVKGRSVMSEDFQALTTDSGARMVFLSVADGRERAWSVYASGRDFPEALVRALRRFKEMQTNLTDVQWVKLDLVQNVHVTPDFHAQASPVVGAGFRGIAFSPTAQFAFLSEPLMFNGMFMADGRLDVGRLGELLLNRAGFEVLGALKKLLLYNGPQPLFTFDTQSAFTDGTVTVPLYRGHRFFGPVRRVTLDQAAQDVGMFLVRNCTSRGRFPTRPAPWTTDVEDMHSAAARAHAAWALARYGRYKNHRPSLVAANRIVRELQRDLKPVDPSESVRAVVDFVQADLLTNAVVTLAALELRKDPEFKAQHTALLTELGDFMLYQMQPDGGLLTNRFSPSGDFNVEFSTDAAAATIVALLGIYETTDNPVWFSAAKRAMRYLLKNDLNVESMGQLPDSPWMLTALNLMYTFERDERLIKPMQRLVLAAVARQKTDVLYADLCGSYDHRPTTTGVAQLTSHLVNAHALLHESGLTLAAEDVLQAVHLNLVFQLQAQLRPEAVMYMPTPDFLGAFRDDIRTDTVSLTAQALQLHSLVAVLETMDEKAIATLPMDAERLTSLRRARALIYQFGRGLPVSN